MFKNASIEKVDAKPNLVPAEQTLPVPTDDNLVTDEQIHKIYQDVLDNVKADREEISDILARFLDMAMNSDSSGPTKEAVVGLVKTKLDANQLIVKVADLMTRIKLKERDTFPRYLAAQSNTYNIGSSNESTNPVEAQKNLLLAEIDKVTKKDKKK